MPCRTCPAAIEGFNIDLANEIGKRLKRQVEIAATQFSGTGPALQAGTYDFVAAPVTVTKERADNYAVHRGLSQHRLPIPDQEGRAEDHQARRSSRARSFRSIRARPTTAGRADLRRRSAGRWRASARRPTPCRLCWRAAPTPTSPATPSSQWAVKQQPAACSSPTCTRPAWCGPRRCARIPSRAAQAKSRTRSSA